MTETIRLVGSLETHFRSFKLTTGQMGWIRTTAHKSKSRVFYYVPPDIKFFLFLFLFLNNARFVKEYSKVGIFSRFEISECYTKTLNIKIV